MTWHNSNFWYNFSYWYNFFLIIECFLLIIFLLLITVFLLISYSEEKNKKPDNLTVYCLDPQWPSGPLRSNHYIISVPKRKDRIDRIFSINNILSIDIIFWKKENTKSDNLTVYCLDPQWPSGPLRSNHYSKELIEFLLLIEIFLLIEHWYQACNRLISIKYANGYKYSNNFYQ